jgi:hypothetical protein
MLRLTCDYLAIEIAAQKKAGANPTFLASRDQPAGAEQVTTLSEPEKLRALSS